MNKAKIYVEGSNDLDFFIDYIEVVFGQEVTIQKSGKTRVCTFGDNKVELLTLGLGRGKGGWSRLNTAPVHDDFRENMEEGIKALVIVDADSARNDGGFSVRNEQLSSIKENKALDFNYFLMPNSKEENDGDLETVLRNILVEKYQPILGCLDNYHNCLSKVQDTLEEDLQILNEKTKIAVFRKIVKDSKRVDYKDDTIWNLNHPYLNPLKEFLSTQLGLD
jgi:hypothetical protein